MERIVLNKTENKYLFIYLFIFSMTSVNVKYSCVLIFFKIIFVLSKAVLDATHQSGQLILLVFIQLLMILNTSDHRHINHDSIKLIISESTHSLTSAYLCVDNFSFETVVIVKPIYSQFLSFNTDLKL